MIVSYFNFDQVGEEKKTKTEIANSTARKGKGNAVCPEAIQQTRKILTGKNGVFLIGVDLDSRRVEADERGTPSESGIFQMTEITLTSITEGIGVSKIHQGTTT